MVDTSRVERREIEREQCKFNKKMKKLNGDQLKIAKEIGNEIADRYVKRFLDGLDRNISAAVVLLGGNFRMAEKITTLVSTLMLDDGVKINDFENKFESEEECNLAIKQIEKEIRVEIEKLIQEGIKKKEIIDKISFQFPKLSKSMVICAYQRIKEEIKKEEDPDVKEALEFIFDKEEEEMKKEEVKKTINTEVTEKNEKVENGENKSGNKPVENKRFKIKDISMKLEGQNGEYLIDRNGVILKNDGAGLFFKDEEAFSEWVNEFKDVFQFYANNKAS